MAKKTIAFNVDYSRTNLASKVSWTNEENKIEECEPFIDYIRCDDGEDYQFLHSDKGEIAEGSLFIFEPVLDKEDGDYFLCFSAYFVIPDYDSKLAFTKAIKKSKNQVELVLGFKNAKGDVLDNCFEETDNRTAEMIKSEC